MGYISFIRAGDTGIDIVYHGDVLATESKEESSQFKVQNVIMSEFQSTAYEKTVERLKEDPRTSGIRNEERQVAAFVYPDGTHGGEFSRKKKGGGEELELTGQMARYKTYGMGKYILSQGKDEYTPTKAWTQATNSIAKIRKLSAIYAFIIEQCMKEKGNVFVYSELLNGSGVVALAMALESMGYERFTEYDDIFEKPSASSSKSVCGGSGAGDVARRVERVSRLPPKRRYGLISGESSDRRVETLLNAFNSYENRHGDICQILIGAKLTRDGLNLANVQHVYLMSLWTPSGIYQAMSRAIRATSHIDLVEESPTGRVTVNVYRMAAVLHSGKQAVDYDMFRFVESKDRKIAIERRKWKQIAVDCWLQRSRNIRESADKNGTPGCDYQACEYVCVDPEPGETDVSTYRLFYSTAAQLAFLKHVRMILAAEASTTIDELLTSYADPLDKSIAVQAILSAKEKRMVFSSRFGEPSLLQVQGPYVFLVPVTFSGNKTFGIEDYYYRKKLISMEHHSLREWKMAHTVVKGTEAEQQAIVGQADVDTHITVLERALASLYLEKKPITDTVTRSLQDKYHHYLFKFKEPVRLLQERESKKGEKRGRGRRPKEDKVNYLRYPINPAEADGKDVYIHTLFTIPHATSSYNVASKFMNMKGRIRILKPSEHIGWRDTTTDENVIYNAMIQYQIQEWFKPYRDAGLFGSIFSDGKFRIHDLENDEELEGEEEDLRKKGRGTECHDNYLIAKRLSMEPPAANMKTARSTSIDKIKTYLLQETKLKNIDELSDADLRYIYAWVISSIKKSELCARIQKWFKDNNLLFVA